jgi:ABC-type nickel/cobalt efflux system permease component RcnA
MRQLAWFVLLSATFLLNPLGALHAHPVPRKSHDRTICVRLVPDAQRRELRVVAEYRLDVAELTVVFDDLPAVSDRVDLTRLHEAEELYQAYTRAYAPILAGNLLGTLDGRALDFHCTQSIHSLRDEDGTPLGHLRCRFIFESEPYRLVNAVAVARCWPAAGLLPVGVVVNLWRLANHRFAFREGNYELEEGLIRLSLAADAAFCWSGSIVPSPLLQARPPSELGPGDDARLRSLHTYFALVPLPLAGDGPAAGGRPSNIQLAEGIESGGSFSSRPAGADQNDGGQHSLLALLLDSRRGLLALLLLSAGFGAAHALTPGHGKTLVAAYLVGERGTVWHALVLGLVTTLMHTGVVLLVAGILFFVFPQAAPRQVQVLFGLIGGLLIAGLGFWLLLRRLSGGADHVHIGGRGHHHHHHGDHYHDHDEHGHTHELPASQAPVGWWGLIILGMSGGIVPCWDAIVMLGLAISAQRLWLGLPLLLAFSAGLALVLIVLGIAVVGMKGFATSRWGSGRLIRALPVASAVLVMGMGLWLCYDSVHPAESVPVSLGSSRR